MITGVIFYRHKKCKNWKQEELRFEVENEESKWTSSSRDMFDVWIRETKSCAKLF